MNYEKVYASLIAKRVINPLVDGYRERHHIIPKSLGGNDESENLVYLTAREHLVAHLLLARIHGGKMWFALGFMCSGKASSGKGARTNSRTYEMVRKNIAIQRSTMFSGENHPLFGKECTEERRANISLALKGKRHSEATKKKMSDSRKGYVHTDETIEKMKEARKIQTPPTLGKKLPSPSQEKREKLRIAALTQPVIKCPHCSLESKNKGNMTRFHLDNCKQRIM